MDWWTVETIHPFLEANGRLGRILITTMLVREKALSEPWLGLSLYFRQHRQQYVELLMGTRETGDWWERALHGGPRPAPHSHHCRRARREDPRAAYRDPEHGLVRDVR